MPGGTSPPSPTSGPSAPDRITELSDGMLKHTAHVRINRAVVEHDVTVIVSPVFPHEVVGFSGGNKYLFPGVSGRELIDLSHWLGALITSATIIGTRGTTPVRALIDEAAVYGPRRAVRAVHGDQVPYTRPASLMFGDPSAAWAAAADISAETHIRHLDAPVRRVLSLIPARYEDMWTGAKGFYKVEPVVADGGQVVLYAPHIQRDRHDPPGDREDRLSLPGLLRQAVGPLLRSALGRHCPLDAPARRRNVGRDQRRARPGHGYAGHGHPRGR